MWGSHTGRIRRMFADQFEPEGANFVYRKNLAGRGVKVSIGERDAFVEAFARDLRRLMWGLFGALIVTVTLLVGIEIWLNLEPSSWPLVILMTALLIGYLLLWRKIWGAPERALAGRSAVGPERSKAEARERLLANMSWGQIIGGGLFMAFFALKIFSEQDVTEGWSRLWLLFFPVVAAAFAVQAVQKWRLDNRAGGPLGR